MPEEKPTPKKKITPGRMIGAILCLGFCIYWLFAVVIPTLIGIANP